MKNKILGILFLAIDIILIISGLTCFIIGQILSTHFVSTIIETLIVLGYFSLGIVLGNLLLFLGVLFLVKD